MKKFELIAFMGKKIVLHRIISFNKEQEKEFLDQILQKKNVRYDMMYCEYEVAIPLSIGKKQYEKEFEKWNNMETKKYVEKYPDITISAALMAQLYDVGWPNDLFDLTVPKGVSTENVKNELGSFGWKCKRIQ